MKVQYKSDDTLHDLLSQLESFMSIPAKESWVPVYRSFTVEFTSKLTLAAADHVHTLWALLVHGAEQPGARLDAGFWCALRRAAAQCASSHAPLPARLLVATCTVKAGLGSEAAGGGVGG